MSEPTGYEVFQEPIKPTNEAFAALHALINEGRRLQNIVADLEDKLKAANGALFDIQSNRIPTACAEMGLKKFETEDGIEIKVTDEVQANMSEERWPLAIAWLDSNNHGAIIKRTIGIAFNKDQQADADRMLALLLEEKFAGVSESKKVHASTLKAWAKNMLKEGKSFPQDVFGIRQFKMAKIPEKK